jgi:thioredoxin 1
MAASSGSTGRVEEPPTDDPFQFTQMEGIVLLEFWAQWCSSCHAMRPELERAAAGAPDDVRVLAVEVTAHPDTTRHFGVSGLPTLVVLSGGAEVARAVGAKRGRQIERLLEQARR